MRDVAKMLSPSQRARIERDEEILKRYRRAVEEVEDLPITHFCQALAEEMGLSFRKVYNVIKDYRDGNELQ